MDADKMQCICEWRCPRMFVIVLHFTNFLTIHQRTWTRCLFIINGVLSDSYSKEYSCLANSGHTQACDDYYAKMYIIIK